MAEFYEDKIGLFPKVQEDILKPYINMVRSGSDYLFSEYSEEISYSSYSESEANRILNKCGREEVYDFLYECFEDTGYPDGYDTVEDMPETEIVYYLYLFMCSVISYSFGDITGYDIDDYDPDDEDSLNSKQLSKLLRSYLSEVKKYV